jgi:peptidoglycan/LPS O-acetylase OafA/YrhL
VKLQVENATLLKKEPKEYIVGLDFLRGIAIVAVVIYHWNSNWLPGGYLGVDIFFVVSGYIITLALFGEIEVLGRVRLRPFWFRRFMRLTPELVVLLLFVSFYAAFNDNGLLAYLRSQFISSFLYMNNWTQIWFNYSYFDRFSPAPLRHLWSLAIEGQFYVIWPLFLGLMSYLRLQKHVILIIVLGLLATSIMLMNVAIFSSVTESVGFDFDDSINLFGKELSRLNIAFLSTPTRSIGLLFGAIFAIARIDLKISTNRKMSLSRINTSLMLPAGLLILVPICGPSFFNQSSATVALESRPQVFFWSVIFVSVFSSALVVGCEISKHQGFWAKRPVRYITRLGTRSYGIYLFHWPIFEFTRFSAVDFGSELSNFLVLVCCTIFVAELGYRFVEQPTRNWAKHVLERRSADGKYEVKSTVSVRATLAVVSSLTLALFFIFSSSETNDIEKSFDLAKGRVLDLSQNSSSYDGVSPIAIGDSIMLGAARQLADAGFVVDAAINRDFSAGYAILDQLKKLDKIPNLVVVDLTNNTEVSMQSLIGFMDAFGTDSKIAVVRGWVPLMPYHAGNRRNLDELIVRYPELIIVDWMKIARENKQFLLSDGVHLNEEGQKIYADLIMQAVGK